MKEYMKLEEVKDSTRDQIMSSIWFYSDSVESPGNIDLGILKNDHEVMHHILDNLTKYYYLIDIAPSSLFCEQVVKKYVIHTEQLSLHELEWQSLSVAIKENFDTETFLYDVVDCLVKTGKINASDSDYKDDFRPFLLEQIPMYEKHFDYVLQVFDAPENQECLYIDIEIDRYEVKQYDIDEVWGIIEKRDLYRKLQKTIPLKPIEKKTKLKI